MEAKCELYYCDSSTRLSLGDTYRPFYEGNYNKREGFLWHQGVYGRSLGKGGVVHTGPPHPSETVLSEMQNCPRTKSQHSLGPSRAGSILVNIDPQSQFSQ